MGYTEVFNFKLMAWGEGRAGASPWAGPRARPARDTREDQAL